ncbi:MAG: hypothetical protein GF393_07180 [Armatimonadia bacterium]|nr:hypothetical protein [Armatimonadia bacterium]
MLPWILAAALLGAGGPEGQLTVESGRLTATMGQANAWTVMTIECDAMPVTVNAGGQGAVINPRGVGWMGGAMGGNAESVQSLTIDDAACTAAPEELITDPVTIVKESKLESIDHTATISFDDGVMRQTNEFTVSEDIDLVSFYPFIYSFSPEFTHFLAIPATGDPQVGDFTSDGGHHVNAEVPAFALYNEAAGKGVVVYLQQSPGGPVTLWDQTGYRKFWIQPAKGPMKAGTEFSGTMLLTCFEGGDDWQAAATGVAADLQEEYPMEQAEAQPNMLYDEGVPEVGFMTVETDNLTVKFEAPSAWTIDEIHWNGFKVAGPTGHYGTVLIPGEEGGRWIGTGHSEGGREIVHSLQFTADGEERDVAPGEALTGDEFELFKKSTIHKFDAEHTVTVKGSEIVERALLKATEDHELKLMYLFMHCTEPGTKTWIGELPDGTFEEGTFEDDKDMELAKDARWVAQYFPEQGLSVLLYLTKLPEPGNSAILMWDQPHYHKFYVKQNSGLELAEGDEVGHTLVFTVVDGETGDWSATKARAEELKEAYPPVDVHEVPDEG